MSGSRATKHGTKRRLVAVAGACLVIALGAVTSASASPASRAASAAAAAQWMAEQQTDSGAFFSDTLRVDLHAEALAAVVAGGIDEATLAAALGYIESNGEAGATEGARTGRIIAGIAAGGGDPTDFGGVDYVAILTSQFDTATGRYRKDATTLYTDMFSNLIAANGDIAADGELPTQAMDFILSQQCPDGGFAFGGVGDCAFNDVDTTALAINVISNSGLSGSEIDAALGQARTYLLGAQTDNGGFSFCCDDPNFSSDSTGLALTAIAALGEDAEAHPWLQADGDDPVQALETLQTEEGSFRFAEEDFNGDPITEGNSLSTVNATPGMAGETYPIQAAEPLPDPDPTPDPSNPPDDGDGNEVTTVVDSNSDQPRITLPDTGSDPGESSMLPALLVAIAGFGLSVGAVRKQVP
jgi:hypothetical protein